MSISELANTPIEITLGGRSLKIQRLSIKELFTPAETKVQQDYIKSVQEISLNLTGKEKTDFLLTALKSTPKGQDLDQQALDYMSTPIGVAQVLMIGLNKCQSVTEDEVAHLMLHATQSELDFLKDYLSGDNSGNATEEDKKKLSQVAEKVVEAVK